MQKKIIFLILSLFFSQFCVYYVNSREKDNLNIQLKDPLIDNLPFFQGLDKLYDLTVVPPLFLTIMFYQKMPIENLSYNVPFEFDEAVHKQNFKVDLKGYTDGPNVKIPKPISLPNLDNFEKIAEKMIDKVKTLNPTFGDLQDITGSEEYKNYEKNGITKDEGTHCNKYKGNIKQEEEEEGKDEEEGN